MSDLPELIPAPKALLVESKEIRFDLYLYILQTDNIIHFRRKGQELSKDDLESLSKIPPTHILAPKEQMAEVLVDETSTEIDLPLRRVVRATRAVAKSAGKRSSPAKVILQTRDGATTQFTAEMIRGMIAEATDLVESVLKTASKNRSPGTYEQVLNECKDDGNPLLLHSRRVSALSVLIQLATRVDAYQESIDIAVAGMIHDLGLIRAPEPVMGKHLSWGKDMSTSEKLAHMKHIDDTLEVVAEAKIHLEPTTVRIIQHHHENWDGSGFKGLRLSQIYRPARILRVADAVVPKLAGKVSGEGLLSAIHALSLESGKEAQDPIFDPSVLAVFLADLNG